VELNDLFTAMTAFASRSDREVPPILLPAEQTIGFESLRTLCAKIMQCVENWEPSGEDREEELRFPFEVPPNYKWCRDLAVLLGQEAEFAELLKIEGGVVDFSEGLSEAERVQMKQFVEDNFRPPLRWLTRE
jgi:hypothetical protein